MISPTRSHPCGCGGAHASTSASSGCGCGCGGSCGTGDCRDGALVRPLFFAGQLLTEEDLQALSGYVTAKSRLHNRSFFGEGVACGFEVVCHPCGGGKVIVRPGHALDCCGNDIVLSAAQTLDVNALARELRKKLQGGIDCGDPCAKPDPDDPRQRRQRYCLYVHYCESQTDPVSAFVTDEPCGTAACEPTRVREGLRFELRCREKARPAGDFLCQVSTCLGEPELLTDLTTLDRIVRQSEEAVALSQQDQAYDPAATDKSADKLKKLIGAAEQRRTGARFRKVVAQVAVLTVHLNRFKPGSPTDPIPPEIEKAGDELDRVAEKIVPNVKIGAPTALEKSFVRKVVEDAEAAINAATQAPPGGGRKLWQGGDPNIAKLNGQMDEMLCALRQKLLDRLDALPDPALRDLRNEAKALPNPCPPQTTLPFDQRINLARKLVAIWRRFWKDCACRALLPPCTPCDDLGVLLACLEVENCEVVKICNLERKLVPTAAALRYWFPGRLGERLCCTGLSPSRGSLLEDLGAILDQLCPVTKDQADLVQVILWELGWDAFGVPPWMASEDLPIMTEPAAESLSLAPAFDQDALIRTIEERLDIAAVGRLEKTQKKSATDLEKAQSDLASLRRDLAEQAARNADLEKRLKALEGRKKP